MPSETSGPDWIPTAARPSLLLAVVALALTACGGDDGGPGPDLDDDQLVAITVTPNAVSLVVGESETLRATGITASGGSESSGFTWTSADAAIALVDADGEVTAVAPGTTTVEVRSGSVLGVAAVVVSEAINSSRIVASVRRIEDVVDSFIPGDVTADTRDLPGELLALAPALVADPDVLTVLVDTTAATAQVVLKSGLSILLMNNKVPFASDLAASPALASTPGPLRTTSTSRQAGVISIGGGGAVATWLQGVLNQGGYDARALGGGVEDFRQYKGLGALYVDSHAAAWIEVDSLVLDGDGDVTDWSSGGQKYGIETETAIAEEELDLYLDELFDGDLIISISTWPFGVGPRRAKLAVTETFIQKHWRLDDAIVIFHTCFGGAGAFTESGTCFGSCALNSGAYFDATPVRQAIVDAGASVVLAYDNYVWPTSSQPSMEYYFDRLTGANSIAPFADPERRPFDLARVRSAMAERDLLTHQKGGRPVNAVFETAFPEDEIIGVPSIEQIIVTDDAAQSDGELRVFGDFSDTEGTISVAGQPASIVTWDGTTILARTPFAGAGATGPVVVESPGGLESNEVPMTEWRGSLSFTLEPGQGSLAATLEVDLRFRADVHQPRLSVEQDPVAVPVATYISPASFAQIRGTGSFTDEIGTVQFFGTDEARILNKAEVDQKSVGAPGNGERVFGGEVTFDTEAMSARICLGGAGPVRVRETNSEGTFEGEQPILGTLLPSLYDSLDGLLGCLDLPMNDSFTIPAGSRTATEPGGEVAATLEWSEFTATDAPDEQTKS